MSCGNQDCEKSVIGTEACPKCNEVLYCSGECRRFHWISRHQFECSGNALKLGEFEEVKEGSMRILGKGSYGEVRLVQHKATGHYYAIKQISKKALSRRGSLHVLLREVEIHKKIQHPFIIRLFHHFEDKENVHILLEYASKGSLFRVIRRHRGLPEHIAWHYFTQTVVALKHLHDNDIIHRDIKPENLLLDNKDNIKICDFGWCVEGNETRNTFCGTLDYMAPEMILGEGHSFPVDYWAVGVLLFELLHGYAPFRGVRDSDKCTQIMKTQINFGKISEKAQELIKLLVRKVPEERLDFEGVLRHPWVTKFAQPTDLRVDMSVRHPKLGQGVITSIQGLLCVVLFPETQRTLKLALPEVRSTLEILEQESRDTGAGIRLTEKENKLLEKFERWCLGVPKKHRRNHSMVEEQSTQDSGTNQPQNSPLSFEETGERSADQKEMSDESSEAEVISNFCVVDYENPSRGLFESESEIQKILETKKRQLSLLEMKRSGSIVKPGSKEHPAKESLRVQAIRTPQNLEISDQLLGERKQELERLSQYVELRPRPVPEIPKQPVLQQQKKGLFSRMFGFFGCAER